MNLDTALTTQTHKRYRRYSEKNILYGARVVRPSDLTTTVSEVYSVESLELSLSQSRV